MSYLKVSGIVIKEVNTGEADKIITLLSSKNGKMSCSAKGARRPKNRLIAGAQYLCYSDFVLFKGKEVHSINSCDVIETFYEIRNDIVKLTYSSHMTDIVYDAIHENQSSYRILQLLLNCLHFLDKTNKDPDLIARIFEFRFLSLIGYAPFVNGCSNCNKTDLEGVFFSFRKCGIICNECIAQDKSSIKISSGAYRALYHIINANIKDLFNFNLSQDVLAELSMVSKRYLNDRLEKNYTKLDFLKTLY